MLHDRPTAAELVEAVREFLETDVLDHTEGRVRFHTRVAVNVLAMVQRELEHGERPLAEQRERLAALGQRDETELALSIRDGKLDERMPEVVAAVRAGVTAKLSVANPRHFDLPKPASEDRR